MRRGKKQEMSADFSINDVVDETTAGNPEPYEISRIIREATPDGLEETSKPFVFAFGYMDVAGRRDELRASVGGPFGPMIEMDGMSFPPPLSEFDEPNLSPLAAYLTDEKSAVARARLGDLLWVKRFGESPHLSARTAITGYLDLLSDSDWADVRKSDAVARAVELAVELNDPELIEKTISAAVNHSEKAIAATEQWNPGVPMFAMRELIGLKAAVRPVEDLNRLIDQARARYGNDPWILEELNQMSITLGGDPRSLDIESVEGFIEMAEAATGLTRLLFLQKAYEKAANAGLTELRNKVGLLIQNTELAEDDFGIVSAEFHITKEEFDRALIPIENAPDLPTAIRRLALFVLPSETVEETRAAVQSERENHPLTTLVTKIRLGLDNAIEVGPSDVGDQQLEDETARRALSLSVRSIFAAEALERILAKYPNFDPAEVKSGFSSPVLAGPWGEKFARAFELYSTGEHDDAVHVAIPRIEGAIRELARRLGVRTSKVTPDPNSGEALTLGAILAKLEGRIDEALRLHLSAALADKRGKNLRNAVSHALEPSFAREDAALALSIAALISTFEVTETPSA